VKLLEFLEGRVGDTFVGIITGVQSFGVFVENSEFLVDGLVHISSLRDDIYRFDKRHWCLVGSRTGRVLRVGSPLEVRIAGVNLPRRQLDLEPVEKPREARPGDLAAKAPKESQRKAERAARRAAKAEKRDRRSAAAAKRANPKRKA
jgi:ribonuclease R